MSDGSMHYFRMLTIKHRLRMEVKGMKSRVNTLQVARDATGIEFKNRKEALAHFEENYPTITK